ncbi:hypothetical protein M8J76_004935 [Diaphorina citri]|nr:hypothetical protein M8J75_014476 [Diaphorina citri]KAI5716345.1 hypothetical protein M8J76_004935 [Diaphorina citri]
MTSKVATPDSDVHITFEDQQKINQFAKHNAKLEDYKDELKVKENELKNLQDAFEELDMVLDDDEMFPFLMGEIFLYQNLEDTKKSLEESRQNIKSDIASIEQTMSSIKTIMSDLKTHLYAKFGNHIKLEADDD